jgi:hypothetical protein
MEDQTNGACGMQEGELLQGVTKIYHLQEVRHINNL